MHILGRTLLHELALTDALPLAHQFCRERDWETCSGTRGEGGGGKEEQGERCIQRQRAGLPQVMMMISIVPLQKQTEPYALKKVRIWEIPGKRLIMKTSTLF